MKKLFEIGQIIEDKKTGLRTIILSITPSKVEHYIFYAPHEIEYLYRVFNENRLIVEEHYKPIKHEEEHAQNL